MEVKSVSVQLSLLLDVGNTNIKYAWYTENQQISDLQIMRTTLDGLSVLLCDAHSCYICCVQSNSILQAITDLCDEARVKYTHVTTQSEQFSITNAYSKPSNMGTDRWMAIIAGGALSERNYLVVDAGTAITCDFVIDQEHKGGWIAPGLNMARQAVVEKTKKVFDHEISLHNLQIGKDTPDCVAHGALAQLTGMLAQAKQIMFEYDSKFDIFISGGDGALLISASDQLHTSTVSAKKQHLNCASTNKLKKDVIFSTELGFTYYLENLVLVGLARIAREDFATNV